MDSLFEASFSPLASTGKNLSKCGKCLRYMRYIPLKPQRLYCTTCEVTYNLPQNGTIKLYKELKCPLDGFELVYYSLGNSEKAQGKSYPLCPYCYNYPPKFKEDEESEDDEGEEEEGEGKDEGEVDDVDEEDEGKDL
jgi:DNA topoisomerase III